MLKTISNPTVDDQLGYSIRNGLDIPDPLYFYTCDPYNTLFDSKTNNYINKTSLCFCKMPFGVTEKDSGNVKTQRRDS
jgi:hypothetical protein